MAAVTTAASMMNSQGATVLDTWGGLAGSHLLEHLVLSLVQHESRCQASGPFVCYDNAVEPTEPPLRDCKRLAMHQARRYWMM